MRSRLTITVLAVAFAAVLTAVPSRTAEATNWGPGWHGGGNVHCVRHGETLYGIAWQNGTTAQAIAHANGLWNPNYIRAGQCLVIPSGMHGGQGWQGQPAHAGWDKKPDMGWDGGWDKGWDNVDHKYGGHAGNRYFVRHGDTLYSIAMRNGTTAWAIAHANGIANPNYIRAGQMLVIPGRGW